MKNKIRVQSKNEYVIEVNEKGETISFDMTDPELMLKFDRAINRIRNIQEKAEKKEQEINSREDKDTGSFLTNNERDIQELWVESFKEMRNAFDEFLGKGGCQKIFGEKNYVTMFEDLIDQLKPHFEKMGLNAKKLKDEVIEKYKDKEEDVI